MFLKKKSLNSINTHQIFGFFYLLTFIFYFRNKMRSLQAKQPLAVTFTYQGSPSSQSQSPFRTQSFQQSFSPQPQAQPQPQPQSAFKLAAFGDSSHIKIVQMSQSEERRERRRKIFEQVGKVTRQSNSRQRNRSYSIFNGAAHDSSNKVKELIMSKESCKDQQIQTETFLSNKPKEHRISNFMQSAQKQTQQIFHHPLVVDLSRDQPLEYSKYIPVPPQAHDSLQKELTQKEKELIYLKLQLERHERCERITHENESIYRRLVEKLDSINQSTVTTFQRPQPHSHRQSRPQKSKSKSKSPPRNRYEMSASDTTRFMYPSPLKKESNSKIDVFDNVFNQMTPVDPPTPKNELHKSNTVTFNKQEQKRRYRGQRHTPVHMNFQPLQTTDEELREKLEESVRRYTNTVSFQEVPMRDKLASMNRHLQNKYSIQQAINNHFYTHTHHSRITSHCRRGRSITCAQLRLQL